MVVLLALRGAGPPRQADKNQRPERAIVPAYFAFWSAWGGHTRVLLRRFPPLDEAKAKEKIFAGGGGLRTGGCSISAKNARSVVA